MYDYQNDYLQKTVERQKAVYDKLLGMYYDLLYAQDEGVFEVTIRSQRGTVTIPVTLNDGTEIACLVVENFSKRVNRIESDLNGQLEEVAAQLKSDRLKDAAWQVARDAEADAIRAQYAQPQPVLAQQAAATAAPKQGRPRKAAVKPEPMLVGVMGGLAAEVPMNGSTAHAAARAVNPTPKG